MSFMTNIEISKSYPCVLYNAGESLVAYHEDHEINGAMYRASNAQYDETSSQWKSLDNTQPSYATVQNPDGSIGYLPHPKTTDPWKTADWEGSANNRFFNGVDYGMSTASSDNGPAAAASTKSSNKGRRWYPLYSDWDLQDCDRY